MTGTPPNIPQLVLPPNHDDHEGQPRISTTTWGSDERSPTPESINVYPPSNHSPSITGLLSPVTANGRRPSLEVPSSPSPTYASSNEASSYISPPSPTLSHTSSVHFATSVDLRENRPEERSGFPSLHLLTPARQHRRKSSNATWASSIEGHASLDGTEPDHDGDGSQYSLRRAISDATSLTVASPTPTHVDSASERSKSRSRSRGTKYGSGDSDYMEMTLTKSEAADVQRAHALNKDESSDDDATPRHAQRVELAQDTDIDPTPFQFKPYELASMLDPKDIQILERLGGVDTLIRGLGTHRTRGLGKKALLRNPTIIDGGGGDGRPGAGIGASQRHDREEKKSDPVVAPSSGEDPLDDEEGPAFSASLDERRRIYGENVLPMRTSKSLLMLMWLALKDKVLVRVLSAPNRWKKILTHSFRFFCLLQQLFLWLLAYSRILVRSYLLANLL